MLAEECHVTSAKSEFRRTPLVQRTLSENLVRHELQFGAEGAVVHNVTHLSLVLHPKTGSCLPIN